MHQNYNFFLFGSGLSRLGYGRFYSVFLLAVVFYLEILLFQKCIQQEISVADCFTEPGFSRLK